MRTIFTRAMFRDRRLVPAGLLWLALAGTAIAPSQAAIVDQEFVPSSSAAWQGVVSSQVAQAQTFTVGVTGTLVQIDVLVVTYAAFEGFLGDLLVALLPTVNGVPSDDPDSLIAGGVVPFSQVPKGFPSSFTSVSLVGVDGPVSVVNGDVLAVALLAEEGDFYEWRGDYGDYPGGASFWATENVPTWIAVQPYGGVYPNFGFKTYVEPIPLPGALPLMAGALAVIGLGYSRRRIA